MPFLDPGSERDKHPGSATLVVDRHSFEADPNPNFRCDADQDPDPDRHQNDSDPQANPINKFYTCRKIREINYF